MFLWRKECFFGLLMAVFFGMSFSTSAQTLPSPPPLPSFPIPTMMLSASPATISAGQSSTISWSTTNTALCTASGAWTGTKVLSGSQSVSPTTTATYTLTCTGSVMGSITESVTVTVTAPLPTVFLSASPTSIVSGSSSTLTWSSTNATSCTASDAWTGTRATSGTEFVSPTSASTYTLTCVGAGGSANQIVTVTVTPLSSDTRNPTKPTSLVGTVVSSSQINLSWTASTDPIVSGQVTSGVVEYQIQRCQNSGCTNFVQVGISTGTVYSDTGLSDNTRYRYRVRAVDGVGNLSSYSSTIGKTTLH